jgi:hypothetical protein
MTVDLIGNNLKDIFLVKDIYPDGTSFIEQAILQLDNNYLVINVNPDTDEIVTSVLDKNPVNTNAANVLFVSRHPDNFMHDALGHKLTWCWIMTNNQGYSDGIQFQFNDPKNRTIQFVALASRLDIKFLTSGELPGT